MNERRLNSRHRPLTPGRILFFGFAGYMLLLGRLYYLVAEGGRWSKDFQSIFAKYDAKLSALTEAQKRKPSDS